ncbi:glycosyltransferase [Brevundimonas staleyi]|uniref:Glycosyltransferase n=1 Tax=Brevundimonas staleyi TaxID=74326 RepID=A0ABW0FTB3_9CAUL
MKIVHVITRFIRGGADENTLFTCNAQAVSGDHIHLIHGGEFSTDMLMQLDRRVIVHCVPSMGRTIRPLDDLISLLSMVVILRKLAPDVVHTHTSKAGVVGRMAAWAARSPTVIHGVHILPYHNVSAWKRAVYLGLERMLAPITHAFVNVSEALRELGVRHGVGRPEQHFVAPSGMDVKRFREARPFSPDERRARLPGTPASAPLMILTAALEPRKRQYAFLEVLAAVRTRVPEARLALLGEGCDEPRLRARVEALGLGQAVHFIGFTDEVARWIASADLCVFASEREGLPRAVIQYVLGGRPVVSTRLPGIEAVLADGEGGYLTDIDRLDDMADPIVQVLTDPALAARMAAAARARDLSAWDQTRMATGLASIYRRCRRGGK